MELTIKNLKKFVSDEKAIINNESNYQYGFITREEQYGRNAELRKLCNAFGLDYDSISSNC